MATTSRPVHARAAVAAVAALATACTTLPAPPRVPEAEACQAWISALDDAVAAAGVADAEAERIARVPGLRVDRVGQALRETALRDDAAWAAWVDRAAQLDRAARQAEIGNLPADGFPLRVRGSPQQEPAPDRPAAEAWTDRCRELTVRQLQAAGRGPQALTSASPGSPATRDALLARAIVPDRYSTSSRVLGLYALLRWPFFGGVQAWQDEQVATMRRWADAPPALQRYVPNASAAAWPSTEVARPPVPIRDALGLRAPTPAQVQRLLAWHAPVFEIDERGPPDRFGAPVWTGRDAAAPRVDTTHAVVYGRIAHMRFEGQWLLQLVYTVWFPQRPARSSIDLLAGALDGVIVRLTLDDDGQALLMDTIHACGCYHLFFPSLALKARADAPLHEEWMFAPAVLPAIGHDARLVVRLASGTHYVSGLAAIPRAVAEPAVGEAPTSARHYELRDENELRSLPLPPGGSERRSLYGPAGLVAGSERGERFLFWPMGIASAGAMRQWGHHATAFVGRRHFDEADLIERRFERAAVSPPQP